MTQRTRVQIVSLVLTGVLLGGCAANSPPAPVEQRRPTPSTPISATPGGSAVATPSGVASAPATGTDNAVQVTGLGSDGPARVPQGTVALPGTSIAEPRGGELPVQPAQSAPSAPAAAPGAAQDNASEAFAVANPAVVALLNRANRDAAAGRQGASAASLERAIKIEPGNAWLWHRLAQTRLKQNQPGEAASIAARSNSLAGTDDRLRARNWRLIASVHRARGEHAAAQVAQRKAEELERGAS